MSCHQWFSCPLFRTASWYWTCWAMLRMEENWHRVCTQGRMDCLHGRVGGHHSTPLWILCSDWSGISVSFVVLLTAWDSRGSLFSNGRLLSFRLWCLMTLTDRDWQNCSVTDLHLDFVKVQIACLDRYVILRFCWLVLYLYNGHLLASCMSQSVRVSMCMGQGRHHICAAKTLHIESRKGMQALTSLWIYEKPCILRVERHASTHAQRLYFFAHARERLREQANIWKLCAKLEVCLCVWALCLLFALHDAMSCLPYMELDLWLCIWVKQSIIYWSFTDIILNKSEA